MIFDKIWHNSVCLCAIIKEDHTALSVNPYSGYIFHPIPLVEGIGIQEGSLVTIPYALGVPSWSSFSMIAFP